MVLTCGNIHGYLGMTIDFTETSKVKITMYDYVDEMICELPTRMHRQSATLVSNNLFKRCKDKDDLLILELFKEFHHLVAITLFLSKQVRPDL